MKKFLSTLFFCFFFFAIGALGMTRCSSGAGGGTPSTEIPAPVSHLSISSPDSNGLVRVTGDAGFADGGSTVTITNSGPTSFHLLDLLISRAWAQATVSVTANADGSFETTLAAEAGDRISVSYTKDGSETEAATAVPENQPPLPTAQDMIYQDVTFNPTTGEAVVIANDGSDGFLVFYNLETSASNTVTLDGLSGANRVAVDNRNQIVVITDSDDPDNVYHYHIATGNILDDSTEGTQANDVAAAPDGNYAVIAFDSASLAIGFYDLANDIISVFGTSTDQNQNSQRRAHWVDVANNGVADLAALVSETEEGSFFLSTHLIDTVLPLFTQETAVTLTGLGLPGGLDFFSSASQALVTDRSNDSVLRVTIATGDIATIAVGDDPRGVAVERGDEKAFVVNSEDRTLSLIDLTTDTVSSSENLGLSPTAVAVDPSGAIDTVIVLNTGDNTLTLIDPD